MSGAIKVGDLCVVVSPSPCQCQRRDSTVGRIFKAGEIVFVESECDCCGKHWPADWHVCPEGDRDGYDLYRCRRIPPLDELEGVNTEEKIREPA